MGVPELTHERMLADAIRLALDNCKQTVLADSTRLEIVRGVLQVALDKYVRATTPR